LNINSLLSAIFTHARRSGTLQGPNPTDGVEIPEGKRTEKTHKYTLEEVEKTTEAVDGVARCTVVVAAWTGLSLADRSCIAPTMTIAVRSLSGIQI
jgi:hypothetical protein